MPDMPPHIARLSKVLHQSDTATSTGAEIHLYEALWSLWTSTAGVRDRLDVRDLVRVESQLDQFMQTKQREKRKQEEKG